MGQAVFFCPCPEPQMGRWHLKPKCLTQMHNTFSKHPKCITTEIGVINQGCVLRGPSRRPPVEHSLPLATAPSGFFCRWITLNLAFLANIPPKNRRLAPTRRFQISLSAFTTASDCTTGSLPSPLVRTRSFLKSAIPNFIKLQFPFTTASEIFSKVRPNFWHCSQFTTASEFFSKVRDNVCHCSQFTTASEIFSKVRPNFWHCSQFTTASEFFSKVRDNVCHCSQFTTASEIFSKVRPNFWHCSQFTTASEFFSKVRDNVCHCSQFTTASEIFSKVRPNFWHCSQFTTASEVFSKVRDNFRHCSQFTTASDFFARSESDPSCFGIVPNSLTTASDFFCKVRPTFFGIVPNSLYRQQLSKDSLVLAGFSSHHRMGADFSAVASGCLQIRTCPVHLVIIQGANMIQHDSNVHPNDHIIQICFSRSDFPFSRNYALTSSRKPYMSVWVAFSAEPSIFHPPNHVILQAQIRLCESQWTRHLKQTINSNCITWSKCLAMCGWRQVVLTFSRQWLPSAWPSSIVPGVVPVEWGPGYSFFFSEGGWHHGGYGGCDESTPQGHNKICKQDASSDSSNSKMKRKNLPGA